MLIDLSRRPVRLIFEECPTVVVIRTLRLRAKAGGLLHHEDPDPQISKISTVDPAARRSRGNDEEYIETVLAPPVDYSQPNPRPDPDHMQVARAARRVQYAAQRPIQRNGLLPRSGGITHLYCVTGYADQITKTTGIWRVNLVFDQGPKGTWLLTFLDETNGIPLLTVNVPTQTEVQPLFSVRTPLQRLVLSQAGEAQDTFWAVLREDS